MSSALRWGFGGLGVLTVVSCRQAQLSPEAQHVATSPSAPIDSGWDPRSCRQLGYLVGRGGGSLGGEYISNERLIEFAMNDLRNKVAALGGNYVQYDGPTLGQGDTGLGSTTTTATVSGVAFRCDGGLPTAGVARAPGCFPGATEACVGPAGCRGAQTCSADGLRYTACNCGSMDSPDPPEPTLNSSASRPVPPGTDPGSAFAR